MLAGNEVLAIGEEQIVNAEERLRRGIVNGGHHGALVDETQITRRPHLPRKQKERLGRSLAIEIVKY